MELIVDVALVWEVRTWLKCSRKTNDGKDFCVRDVLRMCGYILVRSMRLFVVRTGCKALSGNLGNASRSALETFGVQG